LEKPLDLEFPLADASALVPMKLGAKHLAGFEPNFRFRFALQPAATVSIDETAPMIVKYMMTSRLGESGSHVACILDVVRPARPTQNWQVWRNTWATR
jgi:hypothetical protein